MLFLLPLGKLLYAQNACTTELGTGKLLCTERVGDVLNIYFWKDDQVRKTRVDAKGAILNQTTEGRLVQDSFLVKGNQLVKKISNGTIVWQKTIPSALLDSLPNVDAFAELSTGELLLAGFRTETNGITPPSRSIFMSIKTDANLQAPRFRRYSVQMESNPQFAYQNKVIQVIPLANGQADLLHQTMTIRLTADYFINALRTNADGSVQRNFSLLTFSSIAPIYSFIRTPCGLYLYEGPTGHVGQKGYYKGNTRIYWRANDWGFVQAQTMGAGSTDYYGSYISASLSATGADTLRAFYQYRSGYDPVPPYIFTLPQPADDPIQVPLSIKNYLHAVRMPNNGLFLMEQHETGWTLERATNCGNQTTERPDLRLANLKLAKDSVRQGEILYYTFDLQNAGLAPATGEFTIKAYLSSDQSLSTDDVQDGTIVTGNVGKGQLITQVVGASTMPRQLPSGYYYLLLQVDANAQIDENNETNNLLVSTTTFRVDQLSSTTSAFSAAVPLALFPNPTSAHSGLTVRFEPAGHERNLLIFNALGQVIFSQKVPAHTPQVSLSTAEWPVGQYRVQWPDGRGRWFLHTTE